MLCNLKGKNIYNALAEKCDAREIPKMVNALDIEFSKIKVEMTQYHTKTTKEYS